MGRILMISDLHLGHENMAKYRGFKSSEEHDNLIVSNWNKTVLKKDTVWILGDVCMEKPHNYKVLSSLPGYKKVVLGNHDKPQHIQELLKYVNCVCGMFKYKKRYWFTHCSMHESEMYPGNINIHGHIHHKIIKDPRYINVSCDVVEYTPVLLSKLIEPYE